jgi:hypothetical protein
MRLRLVVGGMPMLLGGCWMRVLQRKQLDVNNYFYFEGILPKGRCHLAASISTYCSGNAGATFSKNIWSQELFVEWGTAASSIKPRSLIVLNLHVKENCVFFLRGESLIFKSKTP